MGLPNFDLAAGNYDCQDCGINYHVVPQEFPDDSTEFCTRCIGLWFACLKKLEQVYIIVPGLPRAQSNDKQYISRYGEASTHVGVLKEALLRDPTCRIVGTSMHSMKIDDVVGLLMSWFILRCIVPRGKDC